MIFPNSKGLLLFECFTLLSLATFVFGKENDIGEIRKVLDVSNEADLPSELIIRDLQSQRINDKGKVLKKLGELFDRFSNKPAAFDVFSERIAKLLNKINALKEVIEEEEKFYKAEVTSQARKFSIVEEFPKLNGISKEEHFNGVKEEVENEAWRNKVDANMEFKEDGLFEAWEQEDVVTEKWKKQEATEVWEEERGKYADEVTKTKKKRAVEDQEELEEEELEEEELEEEELEEEEEELKEEKEELEEEEKELEEKEEELEKEEEELEKEEEEKEIAAEEKEEENELPWRYKREPNY